MDLQTLQNAIRNALSGTSFSLDASVFAMPPTAIHTLFGHLFQKAQLDLSNASVAFDSNTPSASGMLTSPLQTAYGFLSGFHVTAVFSLDAQKAVQLKMTLQPPPDKIDNWGLPEALTGWDESLAAAFRWSNAAFKFDTSNPAQLPPAFPTEYGLPAPSVSISNRLQRGMAFQADLEYKGKESDLVWLLGGKKVQVQGPIEWDGHLPAMDLASAPLASLSLEKFTLPVKFHFVSVLLEVPASRDNPATVVVIPLGLIEGDLGLPTGGPGITVPFYVQLYSDPPGQVNAVGNFRQASSFGLTELAKLMGVDSLSSQESPQFPALKGLSLETIVLTVQPHKRALISAAATVSYTPPGGAWKPFGELLAFEGLFVTFAAHGPFSEPSLETVVDCKARLAGGELDAWIALPDLSFCCELLDGTNNPIDLTQILDSITGGAFTQHTPNFKLQCTQLRVLGNASQNLYRFQATVRDNWSFDVLGTKFALSSIGFDITHQAGTGASTRGQVVAQLIVAGIAVQISADYEGAQQGWSFSGGTLGPQDISLTDLINDVLKLFGLSLPAHAPQVSITGLQMMLQTGNMDFGFSCEGRVSMLGTTVDIGIDLGRTHDDAQHPQAATTVFTGYLSIGPSTFEVDFTAAPTGNSLLFTWTDTDQPLTFEHIAEWFGYTDMPHLPENLDLSLTAAGFYYDFDGGTLVFSAASKNYGQILFASFLPKPPSTYTKRIYLLELDVQPNLDLSHLPLIGDHLLKQPALGVKDLQIILASEKFGVQEIEQLKPIIGKFANNSKLPDGLAKGAQLGITFFIGEKVQPPLTFQLTGASKQAPREQPRSLGVAPPAAGPPPEAWLDIQRSFGPVNIKRIGIGYASPNIVLMLDAALVLSGLTLEMDGLGLKFPLKDPLNHITPNLRGMSLTYQSGPLEISGGFLNVYQPSASPLKYEYNGELLIQAEGFGLSAIGSFAEFKSPEGSKSLFLFGVLNATLGGPAFFVVTGIAAGFGYNRSLTIPTLDQLPAFPLVAAAMPTPTNPSPFSGEKATDPAQAMGVINDWVYPALGQNWLAAGIKFTSFKILESFALLTVSFGNRFEIALLGLSSLTMPPLAPKPIGFAQLALEVTYAPDDGVLKVAAQLTPGSYILSEACHLTGGFALYTWFKAIEKDEVHAGDFVVSLGGYSPYFKKPAGYPSVPLVGANWQVSDNLTIKGGFYFALTPVAVMAGGTLEASFESGSFKAWFNAKADFLLYWEPFHYLANLSLNLGASYTLGSGTTAWTITVHVGVDVTLHGPPFGGTAVIDLYVFSIAIDFGPKDSSPQPLKWEEFRAHYLLPNDHSKSGGATPHALGAGKQSDTICFSRVSGGLIKELPSDPAGKAPDWIINPEKFEIVTASKIPCSEAHLLQTVGDQHSSHEVGAKQISHKFGVTACGIDNGALTSIHTITWKTEDGGPVIWARPTTPTGKDDVLPAVTSRFPRAAWFKDAKTDPRQPPSMTMINGDRVTDELTTGFTLKPTVAKPDEILPIEVDKLEVELYTINEKNGAISSWANPTIPTADDKPVSPATRMAELAKVDTNLKRDKIASALQRQGSIFAATRDTKYLAFAAKHSELLAAPVICPLGEQNR